MLESHLDLLRTVLSTPTKTGHEEFMVLWLSEYFKQMGYSYYLDHKNNIYVTKGESEIYPCILAHTDTVHSVEEFTVLDRLGFRPPTFGKTYRDVEPRHQLYALNGYGEPSGIGGDDKCGVYVCLRLLSELDICKAVFFVSEEIGCLGSKEADPQFFTNVGYAIQFDAPGNHLVTEICNGVRLFDRESEFYSIFSNTLRERGNYLYQSHPYTDISQLKIKFDFACLNISCGYYNMHSKYEIVDVQDVEDTVITGKELIDKLGLVKYPYVVDYEAERLKQREEWEKQFKFYNSKWNKKHKKKNLLGGNSLNWNELFDDGEDYDGYGLFRD